MLITLLLTTAISQASSAQEPTRESLVAQYGLVLKRWDQDRDSRLSSGEIDRMIETGLRSPQPLSAEDEVAFKEEMRRFYQAQDVNRDGFVEARELEEGALIAFACIDADRNGRASNAEIEQGTSRCLTR